MLINNTIFPGTDPVIIFTVLIGVILLSPGLFRIVKIPEVASYIIAGMLIGPYGFNILARDSSIELLGTIGLLYIMFLAGIDLDIDKFKLNKKKSIIFGMITFFIPFVIGMIVITYFIDPGIQGALLISVMFSTHTLIAYPVVRKLGINKDISVLTAVGGTIITDTLVLFLLSFITHADNNDHVFLLVIYKMALLLIFLFLIFIFFPIIAKWFFKYVKRDRPIHFLFILLMAGIASVLAELIGIEAIIGAFMAGLALNKSVPKSSLLMQHIEFVGNILFIPVFLIGIGMMINIEFIYSDNHFFVIAGILISTAITGKWLAAFITQKLLRFSSTQGNLIFGLSTSHAAATIAVILIGFEKQIIDLAVFNSTILVILVSCFLASFITAIYGKRLARSVSPDEINMKQRNILVPVSNPASVSKLVHLASHFQDENPVNPIYILNIVNDNALTKDNVKRLKQLFDHQATEHNALTERISILTRIDVNVANGIIRTAKEYLVSDIVLGWSEKATTSQHLFGSVFDHLVNSPFTIYSCNIKDDFNKTTKMVITLPENIEYEPAFQTIIKSLIRLSAKQHQHIDCLCTKSETMDKVRQIFPNRKTSVFNFTLYSETLPKIDKEHFYVLFLLKKQSVSYNKGHNSQIRKFIASHTFLNFTIVIPGYE